jgi:glycerophosphoryl diester phosphodiesterase
MCASCASVNEPRMVVIAHRGDSKQAPENTLAAFRQATRTGANYVELDARASADGTLYVLHDATLDRTTNAVRVLGRTKVALKQLHDKQINELDAGGWFADRFAGERVPTLTAALDVIQAGSRTLLEQKDGSAEAYVRLLREKRLVGKLIVQSFDWQFLADLHKLEPNQRLAALGEKQMDDSKWAKLPGTGARIAAWRFDDLSTKLVAQFHGRGYKVWAWTPDNPDDWDRLIEMGVDGIITNQPRDLVDRLREQAAKAAQNKE